jgi:P-type Cu+ transporter
MSSPMKGKLPLVPAAAPRPPASAPASGELDPVCGMTVDPRTAAGSHVHGGRAYWFCSRSCVERFQADPGRYLGAGGRFEPHPPASDAVGQPADHTCPMHPDVRLPATSACPTCGMALEPVALEAPATRTEWVCPMHPEIVRSAPGACPICGMALEPRTVTLAEEVSPELRDMTRRFWVGLVLTVPLLAVAMSDLIPGQPLQHAVPPGGRAWLQLVLATPVVLWGGWPFFERGWASVVNRSPNMFTLIALGTGAAWLFSVVATLAPGLFPDSFHTHGGEVGLYFEAAAIITVLVLLGQVLARIMREG